MKSIGAIEDRIRQSRNNRDTVRRVLNTCNLGGVQFREVLNRAERYDAEVSILKWVLNDDSSGGSE